MYNPRAGGKGKESWSGGASLLCLERKGSEADSGGAIGVYDTLGVRFFLLFILWILIRVVSCVAEGGGKRVGAFRGGGGAEGAIRKGVEKVEGMRVSALLRERERGKQSRGREGGR